MVAAILSCMLLSSIDGLQRIKIEIVMGKVKLIVIEDVGHVLTIEQIGR